MFFEIHAHENEDPILDFPTNAREPPCVIERDLRAVNSTRPYDRKLSPIFAPNDSPNRLPAAGDIIDERSLERGLFFQISRRDQRHHRFDIEIKSLRYRHDVSRKYGYYRG